MRKAALPAAVLAACLPRCLAADVFADFQKTDSQTYQVEGGFSVDASSHLAWEVLTDYDRIGNFVPDVRASKVKEKRANGVLLEQETLGKVFFISVPVRVLLDVREEPFQRIEFRDVGREDFQAYEGSWAIAESSGHLKVAYRLSAKPLSKAPRFIVKRAFAKSAVRLLEKVRAEIDSRAKRAGPS